MAKSASMSIVTDTVQNIIKDGTDVVSISDICDKSGLDISRVNGCISYYVRAGLAIQDSQTSIRILNPLKVWKPGDTTPVNTAKIPNTGKRKKNKLGRGFLSGFGLY